MLTDKQLYDVIYTVTNDIEDLSQRNVLTNSFRVLDVLAKLGFDSTSTYLVISSKNREIATDLYVTGANVYIAPLNHFAKDFKRQFEFILLDVDGVSCSSLDLFSEVITHGAKDGCIICLMSSCDSIGDEATEKVEQIIKDITEVYCSDESDTSEALYARRLHVHLNSTYTPLALTPWYSSFEIKRVGSRFKGLIEKPGALLPSVKGGETPFLGTRNYAFLCFMMKHLSSFCIKTHSFLVPAVLFFIDDGERSTGIAYAAEVHRGPKTIDQKRYRSKCSELVANNPPFMYSIVNNTTPSRKDIFPVKDTVTTEKALCMGPVVTSIGKSPDSLILEQRWYEKLKTTIETCATPERVTQIINEFKAWVAEHGGKGVISPASLQAKFSEYPELSEFVSLISDMTGDKKS